MLLDFFDAREELRRDEGEADISEGAAEAEAAAAWGG